VVTKITTNIWKAKKSNQMVQKAKTPKPKETIKNSKKQRENTK
jgi:hypothetical protein